MIYQAWVKLQKRYEYRLRDYSIVDKLCISTVLLEMEHIFKNTRDKDFMSLDTSCDVAFKIKDTWRIVWYDRKGNKLGIKMLSCDSFKRRMVYADEVASKAVSLSYVKELLYKELERRR